MPPIKQLLAEYEQARASQDDRVTAETAYALTMRMMDSGSYDEAKRYANESYRAAKRLPSSLTDDVASTRTTVGGVPLPDYFHEGVIRARLGGLLET